MGLGQFVAVAAVVVFGIDAYIHRTLISLGLCLLSIALLIL